MPCYKVHITPAVLGVDSDRGGINVQQGNDFKSSWFLPSHPRRQSAYPCGQEYQENLQQLQHWQEGPLGFMVADNQQMRSMTLSPTFVPCGLCDPFQDLGNHIAQPPDSAQLMEIPLDQHRLLQSQHQHQKDQELQHGQEQLQQQLDFRQGHCLVDFSSLSDSYGCSCKDSHRNPIQSQRIDRDHGWIPLCPRSAVFPSWTAEHTLSPAPLLSSSASAASYASSSLSYSSSSPSTTSLVSPLSSTVYSYACSPTSSSSSASSLTSSPPYTSRPILSLSSPPRKYYTRKRPALSAIFSIPSSPTAASPPQLQPQPQPQPSRSRQISALASNLNPSIFSLSSSLLSSSFRGSAPEQLSTSLIAESTTSTTLSYAYSQPFFSIPRTFCSNQSANKLLRALDTFSTLPTSPKKMGRQRSRSTSSIGMLAKSPTALSASLSTSVALYDNQRPPKTLHDILLQAQSHYISHRYVPALALYKLAAEGHNSIPACSSLYALYTSTLSVPGLIRSDTKATHILIHALRIWTARRWSYSRLVDRGSMRSSTRDEHDELEEYFAHPRRISKVQRRTNVSEISIPIRKHASKHSRSSKVVAQSVESEYRTPLHLTGQDNQDQGDSKNDAEEREDEDEGDDCEGCDGCDDYDDCDESDYEDEEQEKDEEGRRIGLATTEIEDIVQKLCFMVQKGVLGLDEPIVVAAVGILRKIERGLNKETGVREQKLARSNSFLDSALTEGAAHHADSTLSGGLLLTQGVDLSFLNFSLEEDCPIAEARIVGHSAGHHQKSRTSPSSKAQINAGIRCSPLNLAISLLPLNEQQRDQDMCRAIRIRIMFTLGWVHQQKGEYHYGAQAYGVCSEIASTGKRPLNVLQQQATVQKHKCQKLESDAQERAKTRPDRSHDRAGSGNKNIQGSSLSILSSKASARHTTMSCASSTYTSSEASTIQSHSDISSSSSVSSSDSGTITVHRPSGALSSFSAVWNSSLFRSSSSPSVSTAANVTPSKPDANIKSAHKLQRSQSLLLKAKIEPASDTSMTTGTNDSHHHDHHHPRAQQRSKTPQHPASSMLTMSGHQKKAVRCGYCGQTRILMPLCVCKKVRYCNSECRVSDLETHRLTGCHAAKAGIGASGLSTSGPSIAQ